MNSIINTNKESKEMKKGQIDYLTNYYIADFGNGKEITRSELRVLTNASGKYKLLTRKDLYKGRMAMADREYANLYCMGQYCKGFKGIPTKKEWMGMQPYDYEVDKFLSENLFG